MKGEERGLTAESIAFLVAASFRFGYIVSKYRRLDSEGIVFDGSLLSITLYKQTLGPTLNVMSLSPKGVAPVGGFSALSVPTRSLAANTQVFSLLSWHTRISDFAGRESEMAELEAWAQSDQAVSIKFLIAQGGAGKSRLAAEFALRLKERKWAAGFVDVRKAAKFPLGKAGTLLVVDYPEEHKDGVGMLLSDLAQLDESHHIRVLFLTRAEIDGWIDFVSDHDAQDLTDFMPVRLGELSPRDGVAIINSAMCRVADRRDTCPEGFPEEAVAAWMQHLPENQLPLFLVATGVFAALYPEENIASYSGPEVIAALSQRERARLRKMSQDAGANQDALPRLLAVASMAGGLPENEVRAWSEEERALFGFPEGWDPVEILRQSGAAKAGTIFPLRPDIVAAVFTADVLEEETANAPELIWLAVRRGPQAALPILARMEYDAGNVLGGKVRLGKDIINAVDGNVDRCKICELAVSEEVDSSQAMFAATIGIVLFNNSKEEYEKALLLNNISVRLSEVGDESGALEAIYKAEKILIHLCRESMEAYAPDLALCLNNLSSRLSEKGDKAGALKAIRTSVEIRRQLAGVDPVRFEPDLAAGLNNLSLRLFDIGDHLGAVRAIHEAVNIFRNLSARDRSRFEPSLAVSLNNLSLRLQGDDALKAIMEAILIRRRLCAINPSRFDKDLATSLGSMGSILAKNKNYSRAAENFKEGVTLMQPYAKNYPGSPSAQLYDKLKRDYQRVKSIINKK